MMHSTPVVNVKRLVTKDKKIGTLWLKLYSVEVDHIDKERAEALVSQFSSTELGGTGIASYKINPIDNKLHFLYYGTGGIREVKMDIYRKIKKTK